MTSAGDRSLDNVTPADAYFAKTDAILKRRRQTKARTMQERRRRHKAWKNQ